MLTYTVRGLIKNPVKSFKTEVEDKLQVSMNQKAIELTTDIVSSECC